MNLKRYRVETIQEALQQIKKDLGPDAIIVSTRQVKEGTGAFGMFGKTMIEVTAAKDSKVVRGAKKKSKDTPIASLPPEIPPPLPNQSYAAPKTAPVEDPQTVLLPIRQEIQELKDMLSSAQSRPAIEEGKMVSKLQQELNELRKVMQGMMAQQQSQQTPEFHENLMVLYQQLIFNEMEEKFAKRIIQEVQRSVSKEDLNNFAYLKIFVARMLMKIIKVSNGLLSAQSPKPQLISFLGPTGVGKTTTAAKVASEYILNQNLKVALITVDTFRVGAVEQLKTYAKIMSVPLKVVSSKKDLHLAIQEFSEYDVVLIDVGGRSQRDEVQMYELQELFSEQPHVSHVLVLSATTKDQDLSEITRKFGELPLHSVIFTKLDESTTYGSLFNHSIRFKKPLTYLTTGQKVPEDLELATKERLVDLLLNISGD